jgi:hypothetical protein
VRSIQVTMAMRRSLRVVDRCRDEDNAALGRHFSVTKIGQAGERGEIG